MTFDSSRQDKVSCKVLKFYLDHEHKAGVYMGLTI